MKDIYSNPAGAVDAPIAGLFAFESQERRATDRRLGGLRMTRRTKVISYGIIFLWMFWPFILAFAAGAIASHFGAQLDEGSVHPCIVFGRDIGSMLYRIGVMGWFGLLTVPSGVLALVVFSVMVRQGPKSISGIDDL